MKVAIWGVGRHCKDILLNYCIPLNSIACFIDSDVKKQGMTFCQKEVISPDKLREYEIDAVVLSPMSKELQNELAGWIDAYIRVPAIYIDEFANLFGRLSTKDVFLSREDYNKERKRLVKILMDIPPINDFLLEDAKIISSRDKILQYMPKNGVVAEVGVAYGQFTASILSVMQPLKFYAIDLFAWKNKSYGSYFGRDDFETNHLAHYEWYENRFIKEIKNGKLEMKQGLSWEVLKSFPDNFFDYVYLDANHSYDAVKRDVEILYHKVKRNGIIAFNDYNSFCMTIEPTTTEAYYGVPAVVNEFIIRTKSKVLFLSLARHSSYDIVVQLNKDN